MRKALIFLTLPLFLAGCTLFQSDPEAEISSINEEVPEATLMVVTEDERDYKQIAVDLEESKVTWHAKKIVGNQHDGSFKIAEGELYINEEDEVAKGEFVLDMTSVETDNEMLTNHLKTGDFFESETYPTAVFKLNNVSKLTDDTYIAQGELTMKDITNLVDFEFKLNEIDGVYTAEGEFTLNRTLWEVRYGSDKFFDNLGDNVIDDNVDVKVKLVASNNV